MKIFTLHARTLKSATFINLIFRKYFNFYNLVRRNARRTSLWTLDKFRMNKFRVLRVLQRLEICVIPIVLQNSLSVHKTSQSATQMRRVQITA